MIPVDQPILLVVPVLARLLSLAGPVPEHALDQGLGELEPSLGHARVSRDR